MLAGAWWVQHTASLELQWASLIPALFLFGAGAGMVLARLPEITLSNIKPAELGEASGGDSTGKELGVAFGVSILGSMFLLSVYGNVVDLYDAYYDNPTATAQERDKAIVELEDWASKLSDEEWQAYLDGFPEFISEAYEAIVSSAYLAGYRSTLQIIIGVIVVMVLLSLLLPRQRQTDTKATE